MDKRVVNSLTDDESRLLHLWCTRQPLQTIINEIANYCLQRVSEKKTLTERERQNYRALEAKLSRAAFFAGQHLL